MSMILKRYYLFLSIRIKLPDSIAHLLYVDNLQIYTQVPGGNLCEDIDRLSAVARAVSAWASDDVLHLNTGKTKAIIFGSEYNVNLLEGLNLPGVEVQLYGLISFRSCTTEALPKQLVNALVVSHLDY